jgi:microcystin-dependent protein
MDPFLGEIRMVGFTFAPRGWAFCQGQILPISQNTALFSLLGTMYGGDGKTTFALPNLSGRSPMQAGDGPGLTSRVQGETGGQESVTLIASELPSHTHTLMGQPSPALRNSPANALPADGGSLAKLYRGAPDSQLNAGVIAARGSSLPHNNLQPYLVVNFIIALQGIFPSRQ